MRKYRGFEGEVSFDGLGFVGPPGAPTVTTAGTPIVSYTSGSGFAARPILAKPMAPTIAPSAPYGVIDPSASILPYYDTAKTFTYTREQIQEMIDRGRAMQQEFEKRQYQEGGDGMAPDLEQKAIEEMATEAAIEAGAGLPVGIDAEFPEQKANLVPLAIAALLIFLMS